MHFSRRLARVVLLVALASLCTFAAWWGLRNWHGSSNYARSTIVLPDGTKVYAVREFLGDRGRVHLTLDSDGCRTANPETDYIFPNEATTVVVYKVASDGFTVFSDVKPFQVIEPLHPWIHDKPTVAI